MKRTALRTAAAIGTVAVLAAGLAACSSGGQAASDQKVTITVGDRPTKDQKAALAQYNADIAAFEKANPNITLQPKTVTWDATTFDAQLAGGSLPDVLSVAFTEAKSLIANKQAADLTDTLKSTGVGKIMGASTKKLVSDDNGHVYAVPTTAYSIGLVYNRDLFTKAGLDPDKPPTTWDEVRTDAKKIKDATGVSGYAQFASQNQGGWMFTAMSYSYGGRVESENGKKAVFDNAKSEEALKTVNEMKFQDGSVAPNSLYTQDTLYKDFAAGKVAMMPAAPDAYNTAVQNDGMDPKSFGVGGMPMGPGSSKDQGTLTGGSIQMVSPKVDDAQKTAAVKWIAFHYLRQYQSKSAAVTVAKATAASGNPVGVPALSVVNSSTYDQYNTWIKDEINVPQENFAAYVKTQSSIPIIPEPSNDAQEVYAALDTVMQAALTEKSFDPAAELSKAKTAVDAKLTR
ncbi:extracellular solute-binding protein [Curtobacterium pusillum]|uniref:Extracellular solute-binding protein n=1 Tax=Curtobacterium pusillum TaxID=69373 RepID=A0ABX2MHN8_9MICO|nr:extracellular solute-binding protein [Curtobacterium pusillum]NUU15036.1 extracellular solute-binding protein [Curtobacterium pusillum]GLK32598.1 sugar ABC transporter substrate-binding protein [Curtobacterium pusillum]